MLGGPILEVRQGRPVESVNDSKSLAINAARTIQSRSNRRQGGLFCVATALVRVVHNRESDADLKI
jgi:O-acetylhomoserine/O-acetylserine sulfhydrylase-like pyridoxal-dependent enzyme